MFEELEKIHERPEPFEFYTAEELWTDDHTSSRMLALHLDETVDAASRNAAFIARSVKWMVDRFNIGKNTRIADLGCGPGLYTTALARRRANVTGIDFSRRSIEYAREVAGREQLSVRYVHQNYLNFETSDRFDLILMIMCDLCALGPSQRKKLLRLFHEILEPGGSVLLDVYSLAGFDERKETAKCEVDLLDGFWSPERYYGFLNVFRYEEEKVVLDKYTIVERGRVRTVYNWLQYFSPQNLEREFAESGFSFEELYSNVAGAPFDPDASEFAVVAKSRN